MNEHTHISADENIKTSFGSVRYLNPGSVSIPKNGTGYSFMVYINKCDMAAGKAFPDFVHPDLSVAAFDKA